MLSIFLKIISIMSSFFLKIIKTFLDNIHKTEFFENNIFLSIALENFVSFTGGKKVRFYFDKNKNLIKAKEKNLIKFYSNPYRCFSIYRNGISFRGEFIHKSYCLNKIQFSKKDVVLDCGANSGDLFIKLKDRIKTQNYIGIEPNPTDFKILNLNCPNTTLINKALGLEKSFLDFFVASREGDSSLIKPKKFQEIIKVEVISLREIMKELNLEKVKLLKLEAEGFEPEILIGAGDRIKDIEYIAIDGGYERGIDEQQTFTTLTNFLINNGFEIADIYFPWYRALFKNLNF